MRIITKLIVISCMLTIGFLIYSKGYKDRLFTHKVKFRTEQPTCRNILRKKVFSGNLMPHKEIKLEAHITGVVEKLLVNIGDYVKQGAAIARIKIQPNTKEIAAAESKLRLISIELNETRAKFVRNKQLFRKKMLAKEAYESSLTAWEQVKERVSAAEKELQIAQRGYTKERGADTNVIKATTKGTILDLPAKEGSMVQAMHNQAIGTVVAVIGDMDHFLFSAKVSELDVVHLTKGMTFEVSLNSLKKEKLQVTLTKISPKASEEEFKKGEIKFEIEGVIIKPKNSKITLRAGYVALAEVIVEQVHDVLAVQEKMIQGQGTEESPYFVKCLDEGTSVKKNVVLGLSDGLYVEVKEGLTEADHLIIEE